MKHHIAAATVSLAAGLMLLGPGTALAQTATPPSPAPLSTSTFTAIPVTGTGKTTGGHSKTFAGTYTVTQFITKDGKAYASGTLTGKLGNRHISRTNVLTPVTTGPTATTAAAGVSCPILHLKLGPLHLNVLGLHVDIPTPIVLNITAVPGAGQLLGNLLCGVANLLDGTAPPTPLTPAQETALLNVLLANANALLTGLI